MKALANKIFYILLCLITSFSHSVEIRHAQNFSINVTEDELIWIEVKNAWVGTKETFTYCLVKNGIKAPDVNQTNIKVVNIPVKRVVALSTTYLSSIDAISETNSIIGVRNFKDINTQSILSRIDSGYISEMGKGSSKNIEKIVECTPDIVFSMAMGTPKYDIHPKLNQFNIVTALSSAWLETSPLGRTEWIKFFAAFYDKLPEAEEFFSCVEKEYLNMVEFVKNTEHTTSKVLCNAPWGTTWYTPGGNSYAANMIEDAAGQYIWDDNHSTGSVPLDFESVYARGTEADIWIGTNQIDSLTELTRSDSRFSDFRAVQENAVFNNNKNINKYGGNDIWERGVIHPEEVIADLIHILHPELLPDHKLIYYKQLRE